MSKQYCMNCDNELKEMDFFSFRDVSYKTSYRCSCCDFTYNLHSVKSEKEQARQYRKELEIDLDLEALDDLLFCV